MIDTSNFYHIQIKTELETLQTNNQWKKQNIDARTPSAHQNLIFSSESLISASN